MAVARRWGRAWRCCSGIDRVSATIKAPLGLLLLLLLLLLLELLLELLRARGSASSAGPGPACSACWQKGDQAAFIYTQYGRIYATVPVYIISTIYVLYRTPNRLRIDLPLWAGSRPIGPVNPRTKVAGIIVRR